MQKSIIKLKKFIFFLICSVGLCATTTVNAATWTALNSEEYDQWEFSYNQYDDRPTKFCAAQTQNTAGTILRFNFFFNGSIHFLEIFDPSWSLFEGEARFSLLFDDGFTAKLTGSSYTDAYTHDLLDKKTTQVLLGLFAKNSSVYVVNSNNAKVAHFSLSGSESALNSAIKCIGGL